MNFLTLVSYSLPNTFGGLSRTVTELPSVNLSITPLLTRKKLSPDTICTNFDHDFLRCPLGEFLQICKVPRGPRVLSNWEKLGDSVEGISRNWGPNMAKNAIFKPPYLPQMGADSPKLKIIFFSFKRAVTCMGQIGGRVHLSGWTPKVPKNARTPKWHKFDSTFLKTCATDFSIIFTVYSPSQFLTNGEKKFQNIF